MGDLAKARMELEELYLGIPDDSVNLTFQDLADLKQKAKVPDDEKKSKTNLEPGPEVKNIKQGSSLAKLPSLDFNRGRQGTTKFDTGHYQQDQHFHHKHYLHHGYEDDDDDLGSDMEVGRHQQHNRHHDGRNLHTGWDHGHRYGAADHRSHVTEFRHGLERSMASYDDVSGISMASTYAAERGQRRRPGIPHSNICTICSTFTYIFRHRCLVCGRVYCRQCVYIGMGEMTEGRKCVLCLGRRFSQRYIKRAGKMGCCSRYPSSVKQAELKWAEKGPRRSGERASTYGRSSMMSRSKSPVTPRSHASTITTTPSFVASSPAYSPYTHHHLPL